MSQSDLPLVGLGADTPWPDGVIRNDRLADCLGAIVWAGTTTEGASVSVFVADEGQSVAQRADALTAFAGLPRVLGVREVDKQGRWFVADPIVGTLSDLPALKWKLNKKLSLFEQLCEMVRTLHEHEHVLGSLRPSTVGLDESFAPVLIGRRLASDEVLLLRETASTELGSYAAPEVRPGQAFDARADVYSLGRILAFLLLGEHPPLDADNVSKLDFLSRAPAGLSRIVRRATTLDALLRYASVSELRDDLAHYGDFERVGLALPGAVELNLSGLSTPPVNAPARHPTAAPPPSAAVYSRPLRASSRRKEWGVRALVGGAAAIVACVVVLFEPWHSVSRMLAERKFDAARPAERGTSVARLVSLGERAFTNADLSGADLSSHDLMSVDLTGADLTKARLDGADLAGASLNGAKLQGASARGTDFTGAQVQGSLGLETLSCDESTQPPMAWSCERGVLTLSGRAKDAK